MIRTTFIATVAALICSQASAQAPEGWIFRLESAYLNQDTTDISGGGSFRADRTYLRLGGLNRRSDAVNFGLSATLGQSNYDFETSAPWVRIRENTLSFTLSGENARGMRWFVAPSLRDRAEQGADSGAGRTAGLFGGVSWRVNDRLTIGPAFGAFEGLGGDNFDVFPAILLDWEISNRLSLTTGPTLGASQGAGLSLRYAFDDDWGLTLSARRENNRFALSDTGPTPGGVGQDSSVPVVLSVNYNPHPGLNVALFAGAEFDGRLEVENAAGSTVRSQSYDTAPLVGMAISVAF
ncbi:hypothetical protein NBRC116594_07420 [Shimia sp. NS0008-38b]|uniref:hypothetical protein n=1 Tax=Shimia sp. NS0008-38b TaxID=3127653 RepID=UPI00310306ED